MTPQSEEGGANLGGGDTPILRGCSIANLGGPGVLSLRGHPKPGGGGGITLPAPQNRQHPKGVQGCGGGTETASSPPPQQQGWGGEGAPPVHSAGKWVGAPRGGAGAVYAAEVGLGLRPHSCPPPAWEGGGGAEKNPLRTTKHPLFPSKLPGKGVPGCLARWGGLGMGGVCVSPPRTPLQPWRRPQPPAKLREGTAKKMRRRMKMKQVGG